VTHGENATVLGPSHGVVVKALAVLPSRLASARARSSTKARNLLIKTTQREHSSSVCDLCPRQKFSVELCPNGNRLWCPEHGSLIPRPVVPENPTRCGFAAKAAGPTVAIPTRFFIGLGL
jgi:hypothetical protein